MNFIDHTNSKYKKLLEEVKQEKRLGMHSFHRYYGKLIPAIPRAFIREFTKPGDLVFDPFSGSGTTALEAKYANRNFLGIEINPLSILISKIKLSDYDEKILNDYLNSIIEVFENNEFSINESDIPFCINRDHWFKSFVQQDLVKLSKSIDVVSNIKNGTDNDIYKDFFVGVLSAIVKQVSNADTAHVFPGISKRMRTLEKEGKRHINVLDTFKRAAKKRIGYVLEIGKHDIKSDFILGNSSNVDLSEYEGKIDLIVTNPPYISSVRYAETLKLELYWMGVVKNSTEYFKLSDSMIGNDHLKKQMCEEKHLTNFDFINEYIDIMFDIDKKQARVLFDFFTSMEKVIKNLSKILKKEGKLVMKISDSKIRKIKIPTGKLLTMIAENYGFKLVDVFNDKINENSRSLLTARNTYSDIILEDNIIIWERV